MNAWLVGAPYVFVGLTVLHLGARFMNRYALGEGWRFEGFPEGVLSHLLSLVGILLALVFFVLIPYQLGLEIGR